MAGRPLHALLLPPAAGAGRLLDALAAALDGSGPAILPLDPGLPPARVADLLHAFTPATVETQDGTGRWRPDASRPAAPGSGDDLPDGTAVVIATSGSSGEPKGVQLSADALRASARASLDRIGADRGARWLCPLPTSHIAGLGVLVRSLVTETVPVVVDRLDPAQRNLAVFGCGYVSLVPAQLRRMLDVGAGVSAFGAILLGGAAIPSGLLAGARAAGARVVTTYGMSETCGGCVYNGLPLDGVRLRTAPDGRIQIAGPVLFSGYRNRSDLTESAVDEEGWFTTSDLGKIGPDGRVSIGGRADEMINTGGEKVSPTEVAAILEGCPGVREAIVFGEPDSQYGQRVTAVVVPTRLSSPPRLQELRAAVRRTLPAYAAPRALLVVPAMPLLPSGKPDLGALRGLGRDHASRTLP
jgi:O-succinylbenzoic acid--CoA ligase